VFRYSQLRTLGWNSFLTAHVVTAISETWRLDWSSGPNRRSGE